MSDFLQVVGFDPLTVTALPGSPGPAGVSVASATINGSNHLILTMSDASTIDAGLVASGGGTSTLTPTAVKTANYTAVVGDFVPVDSTSASPVITLPTAPADKSQVGVKLVIKPGSNTASIACGGADVINKVGGSVSLTLTLLSQGVVLQYKASTAIWYLVSDDLALSQLDLRYDAINAASAAQSFAIQRANHTGTQSADTLTDGTTNKAFLATERTKLTAITGTNTGDQTITLTGDATASGTGSMAVTVGKINGTALSGLGTGLLKNTTGTGVPSIAAGADIPNIAESQVTNLVTDLASKATKLVPTASKTGAYNAVDGDLVLADATSAGFTVTLPTPTAGRCIGVKKTDSSANVVTVATTSGVIDGSATRPLSAQYQSQVFVADGTNWQRDVVPGVAAIAASGTPSSTTFLRGDGSWQTPAGGGGTALLACSSYAPGTSTQKTTSSTTVVAIDTTNLATGSFTAPASGRVLVRLTGLTRATATVYWGLFDHGTSTVRGTLAPPQWQVASNLACQSVAILVTGLTSGNSYNFDWAWGVVSGSSDLYCMGPTSPSGTPVGAPATMEVWSA